MKRFADHVGEVWDATDTTEVPETIQISPELLRELFEFIYFDDLDEEDIDDLFGLILHKSVNNILTLNDYAYLTGWEEQTEEDYNDDGDTE